MTRATSISSMCLDDSQTNQLYITFRKGIIIILRRTLHLIQFHFVTFSAPSYNFTIRLFAAIYGRCKYEVHDRVLVLALLLSATALYKR